MSTEAPERGLKLFVDGINTGNLDAFMSLCEPEAAFALQPGTVAQGLAGVRESLEAFMATKGFVLDNPCANSDAHLVSGILDELKGVEPSAASSLAIVSRSPRPSTVWL